MAAVPDVQIQHQLIHSNPLNCTWSLEVLYSIFTNIWLSGGRHINIRSYIYSGCSSFPVWYSSGLIGWRCMCWPLNHCLKIVGDLLDMSFSPSKIKISIWRKFEVINKKVTWIHPRLTEWFKIAIGGIFNIYKYMITWRSPHQCKVIFTLDVERFLSDTVADSSGEGACVDLSIIAWKFSVNFRIFSFPQRRLSFLSERNLRSLNKKVTWIRPRLTNYT